MLTHINRDLNGWPILHHNFFFSWCYNPLWVCILQPSSAAIASSRTRFLDHTKRRATIGRVPLDEWLIRRRDFYLTTHNTHDKHPCPRWDPKPRSQQASGRRPTPETARLLGPALHHNNLDKYLQNNVQKPEDGSSRVTLICSVIEIDAYSNGIRSYKIKLFLHM